MKKILRIFIFPLLFVSLMSIARAAGADGLPGVLSLGSCQLYNGITYVTAPLGEGDVVLELMVPASDPEWEYLVAENSPFLFFIADNYVYYIANQGSADIEHHMYRRPLDGGEPQLVWENLPLEHGAYYYDGYLYSYSAYPRYYLERLNVHTLQKETLLEDCCLIFGYDSSSLYFQRSRHTDTSLIDTEFLGYYQLNLQDLSVVKTALDDNASISALQCPGNIYVYVKYTKESGFKLCLAPSDFNRELELADTSRYVSNRSGRNAIAYIDEAGHTLCTFDLDTGKKKVLKTLAADGDGYFSGIFAYFNGNVYYWVCHDSSYSYFRVPEDRALVYLNGEEITFGTEPVVENEQLLVPVQELAEAMGDSLYWNESIQSAMIPHGEYALILSSGSETLILAGENSVVNWERSPLGGPARLIGDTLFVPAQAYCEALSCSTDWDSGLQTLTITYDPASRGADLDETAIEQINLAVYLYRDPETFRSYTEVINDFYEHRNSGADALAMGWTDMEMGIRELIKSGGSLSEARSSLSRNTVRKSLAAVLKKLPENTVYTFDAEDALPLKEPIDSAASIIGHYFGEYSPLIKTAADALDKSGKVLDWTSFTAEELAFLSSDYTVNIAYLKLMENYCTDEFMDEVIRELLSEYTLKWETAVFDMDKKALSQYIKKQIGNTSDLLIQYGNVVLKEVKGLYSIAAFAVDTGNAISGLDEKADALYDFYGLYCFNYIIDSMYSSLRLDAFGSFSGTGEEMSECLEQVKNVFELEKAAKILAYESMAAITNDKAAKAEAQRCIDELSGLSYIIWQ